MKKLTIKSLITSMVVASPLLFSLDVSADDGKIYSGSECVHRSGSTSYSRNHGMFMNTSDKERLIVTCPVTKDVFAHNLKSGWLRLVDTSRDENIECSMYSKFRKQNGSWTNYWSGRVYSKGWGTHTQKISFNGMGHVSSNSNYFVRCIIPKRDIGTKSASYILSYSATEYN